MPRKGSKREHHYLKVSNSILSYLQFQNYNATVEQICRLHPTDQWNSWIQTCPGVNMLQQMVSLPNRKKKKKKKPKEQDEKATKENKYH